MPLHTTELHIDRDRLLADIETLASFSGDTPPGITRLVFSAADQQARTWLKSQCREAGLAVREDAVGNMFARWVGARPELGAIGTGSHIDAVPHSGKFDGTVGVLGGLEAIRALQQSGFQAAAFHRAVALYRRGADPLWPGMPGQPHVDRRPGRRRRCAAERS